jgi:hypothetical protein
MKKSNHKLRELVGDFDPSAPPPVITPLPEGVARPLWSVMIPTFNCAELLRQTLTSVLSQDPGSDKMQIEVVDDCSTKDDPEAVVTELGRGRVEFYRKPKNEGAIPNFNTCIERSRGELVHILHGDDWVLPGFYEEVDRAFAAAPEAGMAIVRAFLTDETGEIEMLAARGAADVGPHWEFRNHFWSNDFFTPGLVFRRHALEALGGFRTDLVHVADWEITARVYRKLGALYVNKPLCCYRFFPGNDTGRLAAKGENLLDQLRFFMIAATAGYPVSLEANVRNLSAAASKQAERFRACGNMEAWNINLALAKKLAAAAPEKLTIRGLALRLARVAGSGLAGK